MNTTSKYIIEGDNRTEQLFRTLDAKVTQFDSSMTKLGRTAIRVGGALAGFAAAAQLGDTISEFQKLEVQLLTATGSAEGAREAMAWLKEFGQTTPFELEEVTSAFVKLQNLGLKPTEDSLRAFGNIAAGMGKSLDQVVEAVADASTSEFERLKEFGIRASQSGDLVEFTFRGVRTTVENEAAAIERYLSQLGEVEFAGATERQAAILGGAFSNLGDAIKGLAVEIGEAGVADGMQFTAEAVAELVKEVTRLIDTKAPVIDWFEGIGGTVSRLAQGDDLEQLGALTEQAKALREQLALIPSSERDLLASTRAQLNGVEARIAGLNVVIPPETPRVSSAGVTTVTNTGGGASTGGKRTAAQRAAEADAKFFADQMRQVSLAVREYERELAKLNADQISGSQEVRDRIRSTQQAQLDDLGRSLLSEREAVAQALEERLQLIRVGRAKQLETSIEYNELERRAREDAVNAIAEIEKRALDDVAKDGEDKFERLTRAVQGWGDEATEAILNFATGAKTSFGDMVESMLKDISRLLIRETVIDPLGRSLISGIRDIGGSDGGSSFIGDLLGSITGSRAAGGPGFRGQALMVGERGPELFVPSTTGNVVPLGAGRQSIKVEVVNASNQSVSAEAGPAIDGEYQIKLLIGDVVEGEFARGRFDRFMQAGFGVPRRGVSR